MVLPPRYDARRLAHASRARALARPSCAAARARAARAALTRRLIGQFLLIGTCVGVARPQARRVATKVRHTPHLCPLALLFTHVVPRCEAVSCVPRDGALRRRDTNVSSRLRSIVSRLVSSRLRSISSSPAPTRVRVRTATSAPTYSSADGRAHSTDTAGVAPTPGGVRTQTPGSCICLRRLVRQTILTLS